MLTQSERIAHIPKKSFWQFFAQSLISTFFSGLYVVIAFWRPEWPQIRTEGPITPTSSKIASSLIEKLIGLTFGSTCVLFLGQILTRRAKNPGSPHGVSLADMGIRNWIIDPGSMIAEAKGLPLRTKSGLACFIMTAVLASLLYGSATSALSEKLRFF
jgi:hypothetical protein